ncbi:MAG: RNA methyltransferase [Candidatus Diapherotrites archaeon]|nr:RNA methyltransferase [Candidatus Diapherotrites archaeon]
MQIKVVLVEPEYPENIGYIARAMANFGLKELILVNPKAELSSPGAISRAMHARYILSSAKVFGSLKEAIEQTDYSIATTAISCKDKKIERNAITPKTLAEKFCRANAKIAIVFGRESNGLTNEELSICDFVVNIPSSKEYRALTISHAAAIIFYELFSKKFVSRFDSADAETKKTLINVFGELADKLERVRNKEVTIKSFRHLVSRAPVTKREAKAIIGVLAEANKILPPKNTKDKV